MAKRRRPATDAEVQRAINLKADGMTPGRIAQVMGIKRQTVAGWFGKGGRAERLKITGPDGSTTDSEAERIRLEDRIRDLEAQLLTITREHLHAERVRGFIQNVQTRLPDPPRWKPDIGKAGTLGVPLAVWSDWHIGEVVAGDQLGGINEFNMAIAQRRVRTLVEKIIMLSFKYAAKPEYPGIVVCLGGDMISGLIHQELVETAEDHMMAQILETYSLIAWGLETLAKEFGRVFVAAVVGNHGRIHHRPRAKNRVQDSFEYLIYNFLRARFNPVDEAGERMPGYDPRFQFYIPEQTDALIEVAGHRFLLTHGDSTGAKGGDGFIGAVGPIVRGEKKVRDSSAAVESHYDTAIMGHYHIALSMDRVIVNPTLKGYDEYARSQLRAPPEVPAQMLLFVHPDYGIIDEKRIYLEKKLRRKAAPAWVTWPGGK